jgi:outer membrane protein TolC
MVSLRWSPKELRGQRGAGFLVAFLLSGLVSPATARPVDEPQAPAGPNAQPAPVGQAMTLNLAECLQLALERQPRIKAQRASLAAAQEGYCALQNLQVPAFLVPDLPVRRRQAMLGVTAAAAAVEQAEHETIYAVTRTYFSVLYAREQDRVARSIAERLTATRDAAQRQLNAGARDVTSADVNRASVYVRLAETKRTQASQGVKRALYGLQEAIGLPYGTKLDVPGDRLPQVEARPSLDEVVAQAQARRAELVRAGVFVDVTCLEVDAQDANNLHKRVETFAAGSDIHAVSVPEGVHDTEYRPGGVPPEMPTLLVGSRADRVKRAESFNARAQAVAETTANLITLEAETAFLRWEEASGQLRDARDAADTGDKMADDLNKDFTGGLKVKVDEVINARVLASQARSQYSDYLYHQILALADLERITGGAFSARLVEAAAAQATPAKTK